MTKQRVAFVTYSDDPSLSKSDKLLADHLRSQGFSVEATAWDSAEVNWELFDTLILRSCWNYHLHVDAFSEWLTIMEERQKKVWNPYDTIRWNLNKSYLLDLESKHIPIIPTTILPKGSTLSLENIFEEMNIDEIVLKPTIGASAHGVYKIHRNSQQAKEADIQTLLQQNDTIVQPFIPEVTKGELSLIFIGKHFSHAVLKKPPRNEFRTNRHFSSEETLFRPDDDIIDQASKVLHQCSVDILYARVDGVIIQNRFTLMELELIEPHLFFDLYPQGVNLFTQRFLSLS